MDIFVRQVPIHCNEKQLKQFFRPHLGEFGITTFEVTKIRSKPLASITVLDATKGHLFLRKYGVNARPVHLLRLHDRHLQCSLSRNLPSEIQLRTLDLEDSRHREKQKHSGSTQPSNVAVNRGVATFATSSTACGVWTYVNDRLTYQPYLTDNRPGSLVLGARQAVLLLLPNYISADRIDINYFTVDTVLLGDHRRPTVTFTLICPPKFYQRNSNASLDSIVTMMAGMDFNSRMSTQEPEKKVRFPSLDPAHQQTTGICFVYQVQLADWRELLRVEELVRQNRHTPSAMMHPTPTQAPSMPLQRSLTRLDFELTDQSRSGALPFTLRFQISRLAQNGKLLPDQVRELLPCINQLYYSLGDVPTVEAVRRLYRRLTPPGPHTVASEYSQASLVKLLNDYANSYTSFGAEDAYSISNRHDHIVLVHKLDVTPAGVYLEGPSAEVTNRVLREYPGNNDYFLRVSFIDEDGESVRYDPNAKQERIYHGRFKSFLDGSFIIGGRGFSFLGFSHSSLRSQTCWFMAPFVFKQRMMLAPTVIASLGDFSVIRSPARCAARIGQAFTDTTGTVRIEAGMLLMAPDVERNGGTSSDGCGTISENLLKRIWRIYATKRSLKPTTLQIRYAGAKGVVSLDSRLPGDQLTIRPSMEKFKGSRSNQVEICGAAFRPLPMILNRQYIKILEDLGVPIEVFEQLQSAAVQQLRTMTSSTINASILMSESPTSKTAQLPTLLEHLSDLGLEYQTDQFLRDVIEMVVITKLRDMKHRGRIPVKNGVTLYGIMDETGFLEEGQIYVVVEKPPQGGKQVLTGGRVVITRSPALHPGDVRIVQAVDVPEDSPLGKLRNCVVFSQHGSRDLPSQLSDIAEPADYPRVKPIELDRPVTTKDMSDFFVQFMETDQLGQISTIHLQLADQNLEGVFHKDCITLAEMASTAVDFSKTGIPVDMKKCPRRDRNRPDFMAPSPRAIIESGGINVLPVEDDEDEIENDPVADLDPSGRRMRYYKSTKALGCLYRAIDEHQFLRELQKDRRTIGNVSYDALTQRLWEYLKRSNILLEWEHNRTLARQIKDAYEDTLLDMLYEYAPSPQNPITEAEIFAGTILGRAGGASSGRLREITVTMRERFEEVLGFTVSRIVNGDEDGEDRNEEALPRALACFAVGVEESPLYDRKLGGSLKSWKYVAAGVCLREMARWTSGGVEWHGSLRV